LEDVVAVVMLTLLTSLVRFGGQAPQALGPTLGKLSAFVVFLLFLSLMFVPRLLRVLGRQGAGEIRTLWVVGLVLTMAWLATQVGYSLALGAFLLGAIVAGTPFKAEIERSFEALRQTFGTVFFVAVGMLFDFRLLASAWPLVLAASGLALLGRPVACALGLLATGNPNRAALQAGLALTPLGEFSFIIAQLGVSAGAVPESFSAIAVGASLLTAVSAPILIRRSERIAARIEQAQPRVWRAALQAYHERLEEIRARRGSSQLWRLTGWRFGQLALHVFFLSALLLFWQPAYRAVAGLVDPNSFLQGSLPFLFWSAFGILLLGPLIGLWLNIEAVAMILAEGSLKLHPRRRRAQPWIERGLKLIGALLLADWLLTLLPLGGASPWTVAGVAGVLVVAGLVFGRRLLRWHSRAEGELRAELRAVSSPAGAAGVSLPVLAQPTGWNLEIAEVTLPFQSSLAGQRIRDTALRKETGASILTLDRQGYTWINPGPEERLYPGDRLLLLGSPEQLPLAEQRLTSGVNTAENRTPMADLTSQTVRVP
ncbi:MAG: cation:proton antiporter, partial [Verrucomicrobiota bacterium]